MLSADAFEFACFVCINQDTHLSFQPFETKSARPGLKHFVSFCCRSFKHTETICAIARIQAKLIFVVFLCVHTMDFFTRFFPSMGEITMRWFRTHGSDFSDAYMRTSRNDAVVNLCVRACMAAACAVIPVTSVSAALLGYLSAFQFILAFAAGLVGAFAIIHVTLILERMFRAPIVVEYMPIVASFISAIAVGLYVDYSNPRRNVHAEAAERASSVYRDALRAPIARTTTLRTEDFYDSISAARFGLDDVASVAYVLDQCTTNPVTESTLANLFGPAAIRNNGRNPFTNLPITSITKVRVLSSDDPTTAPRESCFPPFPSSTTDTPTDTRRATPSDATPYQQARRQEPSDVTVGTFGPQMASSWGMPPRMSDAEFDITSSRRIPRRAPRPATRVTVSPPPGPADLAAFLLQSNEEEAPVAPPAAPPSTFLAAPNAPAPPSTFLQAPDAPSPAPAAPAPAEHTALHAILSAAFPSTSVPTDRDRDTVTSVLERLTRARLE